MKATGAKIWKLSDMDLKSHSRWYDYARARDDMFAATDSEWAPWHVVRTDDKRRGRLNLITHLLSQVQYEPLVPKKVTFPKRDDPGDYVEPDLSPATSRHRSCGVVGQPRTAPVARNRIVSR